jgi:hypothetical protein
VSLFTARVIACAHVCAQVVRRTMHRRCIFCSGARRDPGVPPPRLPNEPAVGEPLAHPNYEVCMRVCACSCVM